MGPAGRIAGVDRSTPPTVACSRPRVGLMGAQRRGPRAVGDEQISVVLPEQAPVLTPQAAAALLRLLRNVYLNRGCDAQQADRSPPARGDDHDKGRQAAR